MWSRTYEERRTENTVDYFSLLPFQQCDFAVSFLSVEYCVYFLQKILRYLQMSSANICRWQRTCNTADHDPTHQRNPRTGYQRSNSDGTGTRTKKLNRL